MPTHCIPIAELRVGDVFIAPRDWNLWSGSHCTVVRVSPWIDWVDVVFNIPDGGPRERYSSLRDDTFVIILDRVPEAPPSGVTPLPWLAV